MVLSESAVDTIASHTWVVRPRWAAVQTQTILPSVAVPRKLHFNSMVVNDVAPAGRCAIVAQPAVEWHMRLPLQGWMVTQFADSWPV